MIIYITAVNGDFGTNIPNQCIVLLYIVKKLHMTINISSFISELLFSSSKNSRFLFFFFRQVCIMQNIKIISVL